MLLICLWSKHAPWTRKNWILKCFYWARLSYCRSSVTDSRADNYTLASIYISSALACIYMDLRNASFLIIASGHHWEREMNRQKPEPLVHCICWLFPANQKANHKHWIVFSAYRVGVALHCALHNAVSNDDLHIASNAFWNAFLFV